MAAKIRKEDLERTIDNLERIKTEIRWAVVQMQLSIVEGRMKIRQVNEQLQHFNSLEAV